MPLNFLPSYFGKETYTFNKKNTTVQLMFAGEFTNIESVIKNE